jgi:hypothetical protein
MFKRNSNSWNHGFFSAAGLYSKAETLDINRRAASRFSQAAPTRSSYLVQPCRPPRINFLIGFNMALTCWLSQPSPGVARVAPLLAACLVEASESYEKTPARRKFVQRELNGRSNRPIRSSYFRRAWLRCWSAGMIRNIQDRVSEPKTSSDGRTMITAGL